MIIPKDSLPNQVPFKSEKLAAMRKLLPKYFKAANFDPAKAHKGLAKLNALLSQAYSPKLAKPASEQNEGRLVKEAKLTGKRAGKLATQKRPTIADREDFRKTIEDLFEAADGLSAAGPLGAIAAFILRAIALTMFAVAALDEVAESRPGLEKGRSRGGSAIPDAGPPQNEPFGFSKMPKRLSSPVREDENFVGEVKGRADAERILAMQDASLQEYLLRSNDPTSAVVKERQERHETTLRVSAEAMRAISEARHGRRRLPLKATAADAAARGRIRRSRGAPEGPKNVPPQKTSKVINDFDATSPTPPSFLHKMPPKLNFQKQDDPAGAPITPTPDPLSTTFESMSSATSLTSFISGLCNFTGQVIASVVPNSNTRFLSPQELPWYASCEEMPNFLTLGTLAPLSQALTAAQDGHGGQNSLNAASPADTLPPTGNAGPAGNSSTKDMAMQRIFRELRTLGSSFNYAIQG